MAHDQDAWITPCRRVIHNFTTSQKRFELESRHAVNRQQPHRHGTGIAYGTSAGLLLSPMPHAQVGASVRYFF
jgi:hypothetical protein